MFGPNQFIYREIIFLEVGDDLLVESFWHLRLSVENPQISVVGAAHNRVRVILSQPNNPILSSNIQSFDELYFQFSMGIILWNSFANTFCQFSISDAAVVNSNGSILIH